MLPMSEVRSRTISVHSTQKVRGLRWRSRLRVLSSPEEGPGHMCELRRRTSRKLQGLPATPAGDRKSSSGRLYSQAVPGQTRDTPRAKASRSPKVQFSEEPRSAPSSRRTRSTVGTSEDVKADQLMTVLQGLLTEIEKVRLAIHQIYSPEQNRYGPNKKSLK